MEPLTSKSLDTYVLPSLQSIIATLEKTVWNTTVRLSETGERGFVQPHRILEWMQEAAANASTLGGYPPERYEEMSASWYIREVQLSVDAPITHAQKISVETWVSDLRRFRSRRQYRVLVKGETVARGEADWLFLRRDPQTARVRPLKPDEQMRAVFPIVEELAIEPSEVPDWQERDDLETDHRYPIDRRKVRQSDIDLYAHVNHVIYLSWLEDHARMVLGSTEDEGSILSFTRIEYLADARLHDEVTLALRRTTDGYAQEIFRWDQRLVRAVMRRRPVWSST